VSKNPTKSDRESVEKTLVEMNVALISGSQARLSKQCCQSPLPVSGQMLSRMNSELMSQLTSGNPTPSTPKSHNQMLPLTGTGRVTQFHCPCCDGVALEVGKLAGDEVCFCPQCNGFVMPNETCGSLIGSLRAAYTGPDQAPKLFDHKALEVQVNCPACREPMEVHPYYGPGNAIIDSCRHCKLVWFNEKELEQIIRAPGLRSVPVGKPLAMPELNQVSERESTSDVMDLNLVDVASSLVRAMLG
jgi:Zn-finger nucleic acid-binding protein